MLVLREHGGAGGASRPRRRRYSGAHREPAHGRRRVSLMHTSAALPGRTGGAGRRDSATPRRAFRARSGRRRAYGRVRGDYAPIGRR